MNAILTVKNGITYRSRLEARWATFFDSVGLEYSYEPEGYEHKGDRYLPDFMLTYNEILVSIKPPSIKDGKEWKRELVWQETFSNNGGVLMIIRGDPTPGKYSISVPNMGEAMFYDCRRCDGVCYAGDDGWGEIGVHTCGDHDSRPTEQKRVNDALLIAMQARFGERNMEDL